MTSLGKGQRDYQYDYPGTEYRFDSGAVTGVYEENHCLSGQRSTVPPPRRRKPSGFKPPTPYWIVEESIRKLHGTFGNDYDGRFYTGYIQSVGPENPVSAFVTDCGALGVPTSFPSDLTNRALIKLRNKIKDGSVNLAQAYGERRQTARLIGDTLTRIAKAAELFKRRKWRLALRYLRRNADPKDLSNAVLEWNYGVRPFVMDIHGAITALDKSHGDQWMLTAKGSATSKHALAGSWVYPDRLPQDSRTLSGEVLYGVFMRADLVPSNGALQTAASLGLTNPASLAWELLPWSFVFDWALPIGDYVNSWDAMIGWDVRGFSSSALVRKRADWRGLGSVVGPRTFINNTAMHYYRVEVQRTVADTVPFPAFPLPKDPFSKLHVLNALSLLLSAGKVR
jgi:hypothetical protein